MLLPKKCVILILNLLHVKFNIIFIKNSLFITTTHHSQPLYFQTFTLPLVDLCRTIIIDFPYFVIYNTYIFQMKGGALLCILGLSLCCYLW